MNNKFHMVIYLKKTLNPYIYISFLIMMHI